MPKKKTIQTKTKNKGYVRGEYFFYYGDTISRYAIALRHARIWLTRFELLGGVAFGVGFLVFFFYSLAIANNLAALTSFPFWSNQISGPQQYFWFSLLSLLFFIYRKNSKKHSVILGKEWCGITKNIATKKEALSLTTMADNKNIPRSSRINIAPFFTKEAKHVIELAYKKALSLHHKEVTLVHLFYTILQSKACTAIFVRLLIPKDALRARVGETLVKEKKRAIPTVSPEVLASIFAAYEHACKGKQDSVQVTELLLACIQQSRTVQDIMYKINVDSDKLKNVIEWVRIRERLRTRRTRFARAAKLRNKSGLDRAMTAVATPFLDNFSQDLTMAAVHGRLEPCVARDKEIEEFFRIIEGGRQSLLLVGDHGVGKMSIIEGIVERMIEDDVPERIKDKRLVQLSVSALMAGTTVSGAQERLLNMVGEIARAKNIILFINNIDDLMGSSSGSEGLDVSETLAEFISSGQMLVFATTTMQGYNTYIANSRISTVMSRIDVAEMELNQAIQVIEAKIGYVEYKHTVFFSYDAIEIAVELAHRFLRDQNLPESALSLVSETASYVRNTKGKDSLVTKDDVATIIGNKTGVQTTSITEDEGDKLLRLEEEMHKNVIGQHEAVVSVANALRRSRAAISSTNRPIANFLFLGSTGVGKTELAKTIANVYFGGEDTMIRVDMSEYQDASGIYRLIGQPGKQGTGLLTEAVRQKPFSLVLLDEMEKADPRILDLFLQVFDDGRLTDSVGRVIDFTNCIIIATSNAGTAYVQEGIRKNMKMEDIREQLFRSELKKYFRPEFINRFDGVVVFKPLSLEDTKKIAGLMLKRLEKNMDAKGVKFSVTEAGLDTLAKHGYDPEYGARPMRRAIQDYVENQLAEILLKKQAGRGDTVIYDGEHGMVIEPSTE